MSKRKYTPCLNEECFFTKTPKEYCELHHVFYGNPYKGFSEEWGMKVYLVSSYHRDAPLGVHRNRKNDLKLKRYAQAIFEEKHGHDKFMSIFSMDYIAMDDKYYTKG